MRARPGPENVARLRPSPRRRGPVWAERPAPGAGNESNAMIHMLEGDLLLSQSDLIAHGVAPGDDFKSGLAMALREKFPAMYKDFRHYLSLIHISEPTRQAEIS